MRWYSLTKSILSTETSTWWRLKIQNVTRPYGSSCIVKREAELQPIIRDKNEVLQQRSTQYMRNMKKQI